MSRLLNRLQPSKATIWKDALLLLGSTAQPQSSSTMKIRQRHSLIDTFTGSFICSPQPDGVLFGRKPGKTPPDFVWMTASCTASTNTSP